MKAIREQNNVSDIAAKHQLHPNQISQWKKQFLDNSAAAFESGKEDGVGDHEAEMAKLSGASLRRSLFTLIIRSLHIKH